MYPKELQLKVEHQGKHSTFLDPDVNIVDAIFVYKIFDKKDKFPFFVFGMPHLLSHIIPSSTSYRSIILQVILRIAICTLRLPDFIPWSSELCLRILAHGENKN